MSGAAGRELAISISVKMALSTGARSNEDFPASRWRITRWRTLSGNITARSGARRLAPYSVSIRWGFWIIGATRKNPRAPWRLRSPREKSSAKWSALIDRSPKKLRYYQQNFLPQLRRRGASEIPLSAVAAEIKEILAQQQINDLLTAWLKSLRTESNIQIAFVASIAPAGGSR